MSETANILELINHKPDNIAIAISLLVSFLFAFIMWITYKLSYNEQEYKSNFAITLISLAIISTILMNLIESNLALSLGMLGSLSIVRFRTNIKDPRDIGFIFWAMAIGIASATKSYVIGLLGSIVLSTLMIFSKRKNNTLHTMLLVIRGSETNIDNLQDIILSHTKTCNVKAKNILNDSFELVYEVDIDNRNENLIIDDIFEMSGIDSVNLLAQNN